MSARLEEAKRKYQMYSEAEDAIVTGAQSYAIGGRQMTKADLNTIREAMIYWGKKIDSLSGVRRSVSVIIRDDV